MTDRGRDAADLLESIIEVRVKNYELDHYPEVKDLPEHLRGVLHPYQARGGIWLDAGHYRTALASFLDISENTAAKTIRELAADGTIVRRGQSTATEYSTVKAKEEEDQARADTDVRLRSVAARLDAVGVRVTCRVYQSSWRDYGLSDLKPKHEVIGVSVRSTPEELLELLED